MRVDTFPALIERRRLSAAIELLKLQPFHLALLASSDDELIEHSVEYRSVSYKSP